MADTRPLAGKYLTFVLGREEFVVPVLKVREIIKVMEITGIPQMPPHARGVINLRGKVIPVIDLRLKFDFEAREFTERTCIIVVDVAAEVGRTMMGVIVDSVSEVLTLTGSEIDGAPEFGRRAASDFVLGLAKVKQSVKILLDLDRVLAGEAVQAA